MWRLLFCKDKVNYLEVGELGKALDDILYNCGFSLPALELPGRLGNVCV